MNERSHRTAVIIFAVVLAIAILVAFVTTLHDVEVADSATPPGTVGLAKPHRPLDVAPGRAMLHPLPQTPAGHGP
jgi:hypothetical protein